MFRSRRSVTTRRSVCHFAIAATIFALTFALASQAQITASFTTSPVQVTATTLGD